jgi:HK97 family phage prohead protease
MGREYRDRHPLAVAGMETRADGAKVIVGYGAVFYRDGEEGTEYRLDHNTVERIAPSAFNRALQEKQDVRGLFNHDPNYALGSTASGTMRLSVDNVGLRYEIDYNPDDPQHVSVMQKIQRKDVKGSSFSFSINGKTGQRIEKGKDVDVRHVVDVDLYDAGPVTYPAFTGTTTGYRSGDCADALRAVNDWRKERDAEAVCVRMRLLEVDNAES